MSISFFVYKHLFKETFGNSIICIHLTQGTNLYNFYLVTVLVVDEYRERLQFAWMTFNREDTMALDIFFSSIKDFCDKNIQVYESWTITQLMGTAWKSLNTLRL